MRVVLAGASGFLGSALIAHLRADGHEILRLVRRPARAADELQWDPATGSLDPAALTGAAAAVNLAGAGVGDKRWSESYKRVLRASRVDSTRTLSAALAALPSPPRVLLSASAIGYYGDRGDEVLREESASGSNFLAGVCREWEEAADPAREARIRVVHTRFGIVLSTKGGALAQTLPIFKLGGGGRIGSGRQWWSWVALDDVVGAITHALTTDSLEGPANVCSPEPLTNAAYTRVLGHVLGRPTVFPLPAPVARLVLGQVADELLLASARVESAKLQKTGYQFRYPELEGAFRHLLRR